MYKKINDKLNDELSPIIENYIKIKALIYKLEAIEKEIDIIKEGKEGKEENEEIDNGGINVRVIVVEWLFKKTCQANLYCYNSRNSRNA